MHYLKIIKDYVVAVAETTQTPVDMAATAEIYCMGIMKDYQGQNYGRKLYEAFESYAKSHGYKFIQVKTVKFGVYECYDKTNKFYQAMGFSELEVFPTLWDEWNPCQILIKAI